MAYGERSGKTNLDIDVLGTSLRISVDDADSDHVMALLKDYRSKIERVRKNNGAQLKEDSLKIAILAGFLLCEDVYKAERMNEESSSRISGLIDRLDGLLQ
ncbi:hypothetical protein FACS1894164_17610 [Spirochaetia bacterium]|nr:hypothetical protein FACS1894164_17610 [Spirochaetia bacterium]